MSSGLSHILAVKNDVFPFDGADMLQETDVDMYQKPPLPANTLDKMIPFVHSAKVPSPIHAVFRGMQQAKLSTK
jgi:hypothetical protein